MTPLEQFVELIDHVLERLSPGGRQRARRSTKWRVRALIRAIKVAALMLGSAIVIPVAMITAGLLFGPKGYEGLITAPLAVLTSWAVILYWGLRPRVTPRKIRRSNLNELPEQVEEWLERHRPALPADAQGSLESLTVRLEQLKLQIRGLPADSPAGRQLRRLLVEELTDLVHGYQKLPKSLQHRALHGGASPAQRLVEGLGTVEAELGRMQDRLAVDDLHTLAAHQRYLELKYDSDRDESHRND